MCVCVCVFLEESCYAFLILIDGCKPENISQLKQVCFLSTVRMFQDTLVKRSLNLLSFQILTFQLLIALANCCVSLCLLIKRVWVAASLKDWLAPLTKCVLNPINLQSNMWITDEMLFSVMDNDAACTADTEATVRIRCFSGLCEKEPLTESPCWKKIDMPLFSSEKNMIHEEIDI